MYNTSEFFQGLALQLPVLIYLSQIRSSYCRVEIQTASENQIDIAR